MQAFANLAYYIKNSLHYFKFEFSKIFWRGAHRAFSQAPPLFISGFALGLSFALDTRALCALHPSHTIEFLALLANTISDATVCLTVLKK